MHFFVFKKLGIGEVKPTIVYLQLVDSFVTYLRGLITYVLIKVDKFIFTVHFIVLDMKEYEEMPLIFERQILATWKNLIDIYDGKLILRVR